VSGGADGKQLATGEQVTVNYATITVTDNVSGVSSCYDIKANSKC
jgi:hypothetical protein